MQRCLLPVSRSKKRGRRSGRVGGRNPPSVELPVKPLHWNNCKLLLMKTEGMNG